MKKSRFTEAQIVAILKEGEAGRPVAETRSVEHAPVGFIALGIAVLDPESGHLVVFVISPRILPCPQLVFPLHVFRDISCGGTTKIRGWLAAPAS